MQTHSEEHSRLMESSSACVPYTGVQLNGKRFIKTSWPQYNVMGFIPNKRTVKKCSLHWNAYTRPPTLQLQKKTQKKTHKKSRVIDWFLATQCWFIGKIIKKDTINITCESFSWIQCLLAEKTAKNCHVFSHKYRVHPHLARWQRISTASLAAAFVNRHRPSEIWESIHAMNRLYSLQPLLRRRDKMIPRLFTSER